MAETAELAELLAHAAGLRSLPRRLVGNDATDAVQETFVAALHAPPDPGRQPWSGLARVLRYAPGWRGASQRKK